MGFPPNNGSARIGGSITNLQNKNSFLVTNVHEEFSMDAPTPNMSFSSSSK
jgi:hypothetical protein